MEIQIEAFKSLCATEVFRINAIEADTEDFGRNYDHCPQAAEPYGCGDMRFEASPATDEVLKKYGITLEEYAQICDKIDSEISFGRCGLCV